MNTGWIKIWRQLLDWEWADVPEMMALWVHLILSANFEEKEWHGITIGTGQLVTTYAQLAAQSGLSEKQVRTCMARLAESGQITIERAGKRQLVSISNYKQFQEIEIEEGQEKGSEMADKRQTKGRQKATKGQDDGNIGAGKGQEKGRKRAGYINKEGKNIRSKEGKNINIPPTPLQGVSPEADFSAVSETPGTAAPAPKPEARAVTRYDRAFEEIYTRLTNDTFLWAKRENVAVQAIVGKITKMMEDAGKDPTDDDRENAFRWFLESLYATGDEWVRANFTPHVICDKFNEFYQTIKINSRNGKKQSNSNATGVSADYLARVAQELAG